MKKIFNLKTILISVALLILIGVLLWQGIFYHGSPDPTAKGLTPGAAVLNTAILVFREGLEAILVLAAIISGLVRKKQDNYWKPISAGAGVSFLAVIATWFIVVAIISSVNASELNIQAATGTLAVVVLLIIMNWFFHKIYWQGWINLHNRKKKKLMENQNENIQNSTFWSLFVLGLTSIYREGFEIVLFLQDLRLKVGSGVVLQGALIGLALTLIVGVLTFLAQRRLPYKKMLVFTGVLLVVVLAVMVGETVQEMQLAGWISTTTINIYIPDWMGVWFCLFPTVETLSSQVLAVIYVLGSYFAAQYVTKRKANKQLSQTA
ncbi:high-affinity iron transporter [Aneurinibacillus soli]|uniref:Ferrous iron permease EfeU n=1 Tax=Aneurinibacillus soli TaxID=1500254 RepID=A0A0U5AXL2_9BACL|nr:FTR1 family protein [Aneurinibacillus soli]PYE61657.1 high-affinity iron transporter [Aneurinibacillus soli]BAU28485.1 Ferrous iron permease EfeU precursor [Aneurinibacillus soli]